MTPKVKANMQKLLEQRDKLLREIEALRNKVAGIEFAMSIISDNETSPAVQIQSGKRRSNVTGLVIDLLTAAGTSGLNADSAVALSERNGVSLNRASVSSTLSRLKADGIAMYDGTNYRLAQFAQGVH